MVKDLGVLEVAVGTYQQQLAKPETRDLLGG